MSDESTPINSGESQESLVQQFDIAPLPEGFENMLGGFDDNTTLAQEGAMRIQNGEIDFEKLVGA